MFVSNFEPFLGYLYGFLLFLIVGFLGSLVGVLVTEWRVPVIKRQKLSGVLGWQLFFQLLGFLGTVFVFFHIFMRDLDQVPLVFQPIYQLFQFWTNLVGGLQTYLENTQGMSWSVRWFIPMLWLNFNIGILIYLPIIKILFYLATRSARLQAQWPKVATWKRWLGVVVAFEAMLLILGGALSFFFYLDERCEAEKHYLHMYNQHLKELCVEREDKSQCPQNIDQLKAFKPETWKKIEGCFTLEYTMEEAPAKYKFEAKSGGQHWEFKPEYVKNGVGGYKIDF